MTNKSPLFPFGVPAKESLELLTGSFSQAYPVKEARCFDELVMAIDEADAKLGSATQELTSRRSDR